MSTHDATHKGSKLIGTTPVKDADRPVYEKSSGARYYITSGGSEAYCTKGTKADRRIRYLDGRVEEPEIKAAPPSPVPAPNFGDAGPSTDGPTDDDPMSMYEREAMRLLAADPKAPKTTKLQEAMRTLTRLLDGSERAEFAERVRPEDFDTEEEFTAALGRTRSMRVGGEENKIVLFSDFHSTLDAVGHMLVQLGVQYYRLDGDTKEPERQRQLEEFSQAGSHRVFLLGLKSGGAGINLQTANVAMVLDPWWSPAIERQAQDRIWRLRSPYDEIFCYSFLAGETVDEYVQAKKEEKEEIAADTIERVADCASPLSDAAGGKKGESAERAVVKQLSEAGYDSKAPALQPHQTFGVCWLVRQEAGDNPLAKGVQGGLLADDMGLGKTLQLLCTIALGGSLPTLVICPLAVFNSWEKDAARFFPTAITVHRFHEAGRLSAGELQRKQAAASAAGRKLVLVTNYETFRNRVVALQDIAWERLVVDESHKLNNRANGFLHLAVSSALTPDELNEREKVGGRELDCKIRWCVTGTPVTNKLEDWTAQLATIGATVAQQEVMPTLVGSDALHGLALRRTKLGVKAASGTKLPRCFVRAHWSALPPEEQQKYLEELSKSGGLGKWVRGRMLTSVHAEKKESKEESKDAPSATSWVRDETGRLARPGPK